ncbi:MAG: PQQ-binding-like beta-propeller repeat protein [Rhodocyclaceae bacterium]|nr:PQQ-binding-like beta-propeller repeat protein [Rhodocyclaceae bacterium]
MLKLSRSVVALAGLAFVPLAGLAASSTKAVFAANCAACHGAKLGGALGPPVSGKAFQEKWAAKGAEALLGFVASTMPPSKPGGLDAKTYVDLTNLILARNHMRALGKTAAVRTGEYAAASAGGTGAADVNEDPQFRAVRQDREAKLAAIRAVSDSMLHDPPGEDWLHWRRTEDGQGFSPLRQITSGNADRLEVAWALKLPAGTNQITPLVHDGVMFIDSAGTVQALDVATGDLLWKFSRVVDPLPPRGPPLTNPKNMAIYGTSLFVPTLDNHLIALDVRNGKVIWDHKVDKTVGAMRMTGGPVVARGKVMQGISGCSGVDNPGGCFIVALDAVTGKEAWRFNTIARPGEPGGDTWNGAPLSKRFGGSVWVSGTYDSDTGLVYFGTAQTYHIAPLMEPKPAKEDSADALYTDTTLALNPDSGALVWHYQHQAREVWDLDWVFERTLVTLPTAQGDTRMVVTVGKLGIMDAVDAKTGRYLFSYDMGLQNLVTAIDPVTGRKTTDPALEPEAGKAKLVCPFAGGARNWPATAYDPTTRTMFLPMAESCMDLLWKPGEGWDIQYTVRARPDSDGNFGQVAALNLETRKVEWRQRRRAPAASAVLATAGGVIFEGSRDRWFRAVESATGKPLWQIRLDMTPNGFPITFARDGTQYVSITTGGGGAIDIVWQPLTPEIKNPGGATTLWVFKLGARSPTL